jgi:FADH2 O2-dependent halogenase
MIDIAVIGSGFGGSLLSLLARRLGRSVLLLEKGTHPRFVIGESSTPLADLLWWELALRHDLPDLAAFAKWGTWRRSHPDVSCGLKRGFTFFHHQMEKPCARARDKSDQLIVAASPNDEVADTHWYRPDFDHFLVREAVRHGVEYHDQCEVTAVSFDAGGARLQVRHRGRERQFRARFVVDAGNFHGAVARSLGLEIRELPHLRGTQALYTHFENVARMGDILPAQAVSGAPYAVDDAALHHVFAGGWIWVLRFANGITSAGVAATDPLARNLNLAEGAASWHRLRQRLPSVDAQFATARPTLPFVYARRLPFQIGPAAGERWALLASAAGFVDPLLSSGFTLTLLGIERLTKAIAEAWERPGWHAALQQHAEMTAAELLAVEDYVSALFARMDDFAAFTEIARLYFCAVIYSETARRLGNPERAGGLLMRQHPAFGSRAKDVCAAARAQMKSAELRSRVNALLDQFDLGGLADERRRPWYPVLADDLRAARDRIGASAHEVEAMLRKAGFA